MMPLAASTHDTTIKTNESFTSYHVKVLVFLTVFLTVFKPSFYKFLQSFESCNVKTRLYTNITICNNNIRLQIITI